MLAGKICGFGNIGRQIGQEQSFVVGRQVRIRRRLDITDQLPACADPDTLNPEAYATDQFTSSLGFGRLVMSASATIRLFHRVERVLQASDDGSGV